MIRLHILLNKELDYDIIHENQTISGGNSMKHIMTLNERMLQDTMEHGGCGECQTSCQSACKTSCTVGNQHCENEENK